MKINRDTVLREMATALESEEFILALWLEGSDGTGSLDEYSDIDVVCYTKEGFTVEAIQRLDDCMRRMGQVDIEYEQPGRPDNNRYKVYHLQETSAHLLIDVTIQSESFPVSFQREDQTVVPVVLFDKTSIVQYHNIDPVSHRTSLRSQLTEALGVYSQRSRAIKYTHRGLFLESLIYYQKYVLKPLVDVLRMIHTPFQADCFLVHATRDFPAEVTVTLEHLYGVQSVQDIAERIDAADELFRKAVAQAERLLAQMDESGHAGN
ncbi:nucleotidyltransferase domain-containing protein [Paenibacillus allorhizosphaerae]|uniref:Polymerase nucleotidyl transferase domain-containing protein n=1 Tax=Paenibacillus allorhizosphaerae TaxID=2849866 RepID=A0ABN7TG61_9BACL|nr:nucleotidyltransferase domain-containing protein [Paenibacillus allorhizosphaerae]CAG7616743.1 hypothetical protein PAECIP111802_00322 [Paenibacillus allorhizosphaerae]